MKLGKRLTALRELCELHVKEKDIFVDMCCDHGYLGLSLVDGNEEMEFHFVDPVSSIIKQLEIANGEKKNLTFFCKRGQDYFSSSENITIAICGVGGDLVQDIMTSLLEKGLSEKAIFILSPHNRAVELRRFLIKNNFGVNKELLIEENNKFYEVMVVSLSFLPELDEIGSKQFDLKDESHLSYLQSKMEHYKLKSRKDIIFKKTVERYKSLFEV